MYLRHDDSPEVNLSHVESIRSLRSIAKRKDEACHQSREIEPFKYDGKDCSNSAKKIALAERGCQNSENQKEITLYQSTLAR